MTSLDKLKASVRAAANIMVLETRIETIHAIVGMLEFEGLELSKAQKKSVVEYRKQLEAQLKNQ